MFPRIIRQLFFDRPLRRDLTISGQILIHVLRFTGGLRAVCIEISSYSEEKGREREGENMLRRSSYSFFKSVEITITFTNIHDYFSYYEPRKFYIENSDEDTNGNHLSFDSFHEKY